MFTSILDRAKRISNTYRLFSSSALKQASTRNTLLTEDSNGMSLHLSSRATKWQRPLHRTCNRCSHNLTQLPTLLTTYFKGYYSRVFAISVDRSSEPALVVTGTTAECRYRLDNNSSGTLILPDGRKLGYAQYGLQTGHAILSLHGLPGSRIEIAFLDTIAVRLQAGPHHRCCYGWSSLHPNRTILDHAKDVEHLTEQLELDNYAVLGISGGGPHALACAAY
jgi:hypothetical protein